MSPPFISHAHTRTLSVTHLRDDATEGKAQRNGYDSEAISPVIPPSYALHSPHSVTQALVSPGLREIDIRGCRNCNNNNHHHNTHTHTQRESSLGALRLKALTYPVREGTTDYRPLLVRAEQSKSHSSNRHARAPAHAPVRLNSFQPSESCQQQIREQHLNTRPK